MIGRIFLSALASVFLVFYAILGVMALGSLGLDMDTPLMFFLMLPTWPFSFLVYGIILDPLGFILTAFGIYAAIFLFFGLCSVLASGDYPRVVIRHYYHW